MKTIKKTLKSIIKKVLNKKMKNFLISINNKLIIRKFKKEFFNYYEKTKPEAATDEINSIINFLKKNDFNLFPYEFIKKYNSDNIKIFIDNKTGLKYSLIDNKKIFSKRSSTEKEAKEIFNGLILVQDTESPHRYLTDDFNVSENDIVADIGAAEGDFALSIIDKVKKVYIFEADIELIESLNVTFEPWKDKVVIVNKYVSSKSGGLFTTLDDYFRDKELPTFLKIDIEGSEHDLIQGAKKVLSTDNSMKVIIATYHKHNDEIILENELKKYNFENKFSKGYMLSIWDGVVRKPFVRRALIRAKK